MSPETFSKSLRVVRSARGMVHVTAGHVGVVLTMDEQKRRAFADDARAWEREMDVLEARAVRQARALWKAR